MANENSICDQCHKTALQCNGHHNLGVDDDTIMGYCGVLCGLFVDALVGSSRLESPFEQSAERNILIGAVN